MTRDIDLIKSYVFYNLTHCQALWHSREKRLLASSCPSFRPSICLPVRSSLLTYQRCSHSADFHEIWYWGLYENLTTNSRFVSNLEKISGALHKDQSTFCCCRRHKFEIKGIFFATLKIFILLIVTCSWTIQIESIIAFSLQQWSHESATSLHYTYIAYLRRMLYPLFEGYNLFEGIHPRLRNSRTVKWSACCR